MQIILQQDVEKLGNRGEVVEVAAGYARNYLLPKKLAMEATPGNLKRLERMRATFAKAEADDRASAQTLAELLANVTLTQTRKAGENDQLFGSVTTNDISEALAAQGYTIDKRKIQLNGRHQSNRRIPSPHQAPSRHSSQRKATSYARSVGAGVHDRPAPALGVCSAFRVPHRFRCLQAWGL